jgi:TfoX/Sxy family transcriptional regulator of competence genes
MVYDPDLVERVRESLGAVQGVTELRMFGGWGVTVHGNMAVGVMGADLIVRVGPSDFERALERSGARPFDFTGRPMTGWVYVDGQQLEKARTLHQWVKQGVTFAQSLPPKRATKTTRRPTKKR